MRSSSDRSDMVARIVWQDSETTDWVSDLHYMGGVDAVLDTDDNLGAAYNSGSDFQS